MNEKFLKDYIVYIVVILAVVIGLGYLNFNTFSTKLQPAMNQLEQKKQDKSTKEMKLDNLKKAAQAQRAKQDDDAPKTGSGKTIYEVLGDQFSPEASFGVLFENILANITNSGVKIRSIDYNYKPDSDPILTTNAAGYNACEISFTTVGSYKQLQNFFKNIAKENYLTNIYEVYIEPYDRDKTILIAKFKIRLYTKTLNS